MQKQRQKSSQDQKNPANIKLKLIHAFGSTCSKHKSNCLAICDEEINQPKIAFPVGKTLARKYIDRQEMDFTHFSNTTHFVQCMCILPDRSAVAIAEKPHGNSSQIVKYTDQKQQKNENLQNQSFINQDSQTSNTIKIFPDCQKNGIINQITFSASQPKFMCCLIGEPVNRLIFIDTSKNKALAQSNFTLKQIDKISICPSNSHLICVSGNNIIKLFRVQQYAFKPLSENHRSLLVQEKKGDAATDKNQILIIQQSKGSYEVKQEYHNVFNQESLQGKMQITAICPFSKGFILGSSTGKFCLWVRKQDGNNYQDDQKLQLARKWGTTDQRAAAVRSITISAKEDMLAIALGNNDIATLYLNELLPQVSDVVMNDYQEKRIFFQYLYKGFHNSKITGMDICLQRPLLATCSRQDNTIRIWNYKNFGCKLLRMFYFKVKEDSFDNHPLITLSFHPSGYYLAVGCSDKLRVFHVLNSELRPYRQIPIRNAHIVKFSNGGNMLATCSPARQDLDGDIVRVYNALTLEEIVSFKEHKSIVKGLAWKNYDQFLSTISKNNIIEWRCADWGTMKNIENKDTEYQSLAYDHTRNSVIAFGNKKGLNILEQYFCSQSLQNKCQTVNIDMSVIKMQEARIGKERGFLLALQNGSMIVFGGLDRAVVMDHHNDHVSKISEIVISPCGNYAITSGQDALLLVYRIQLQVNGVLLAQQQNGNSTVDDFLADVVLIPKSQIIKYNQKQADYSKLLNTLTKKLNAATQQSQKKYATKAQQIQSQKNRIIQDFTYRVERLKQQIQIIIKKHQDAANNLDQQNLQQAEKLQATYEEKLKFELQKFFQLEQQMIQSKLTHQKQMQTIKKKYNEKLDILRNQFAKKFQQSQQIYVTSKSATQQANKIFDERFMQIENQQQQEVRQLKQKKQKFKDETAKGLQQLYKRLQKLKKDYQRLSKDKDEAKRINEDLSYNRKKLKREVEEARQKLKQANIQFADKIQVLQNKEKKIVESEKKVNDLQKNKHILSYKATEMRKAIQPKQMQIQKLKEDLIKLKKQFQSSLQKKQKAVLFMQKIEKERQYAQKCLNDETEQTSKKSIVIDQILYDVHNCININGNSQQINTDTKMYQKQWVKLYHKYVQKSQKKTQIQDPKGVQQMTKQIVHLQKSLFQINRANQKALMRRNDQIQKRIKQNAQLLNNLNEIKKEKQELTLKIRAKKEEVQKLRLLKNEMLTQFKNKNIKIYQNQDEEQLIGSSFDNKPYDKSRIVAVDAISKKQDPKEGKQKAMKKQNQIVSDIQFINERIHKLQFFTNEIHQKIKKHFNVFKCPGELIQEDDFGAA